MRANRLFKTVSASVKISERESQSERKEKRLYVSDAVVTANSRKGIVENIKRKAAA